VKVNQQTEIERLVSLDQLDGALRLLVDWVGHRDPKLRDQAIAKRGEFARLEEDVLDGTRTESEGSAVRARIRRAILYLAGRVARLDGLGPERINPPVAERGPSTFLSYAHEDREAAHLLRTALEQRGVRVYIDSDAMNPGERIEAFVLRALRCTQTTIGIVSPASLLSGWVALEMMAAIHAEQTRGQVSFIACYVDEAFLDDGIRLALTEQIDERIRTLDSLIPEYRAQRLDLDDINAQRSRFLRLRGNLGEILARVRESLALNIRPPELERSAARIADVLRDDTR
jgi:hypothetical protein